MNLDNFNCNIAINLILQLLYLRVKAMRLRPKRSWENKTYGIDS